MSLAFLFPGQGAQFAGMGRDWCEAWPRARETFAEADEALGFALTEACWERGEDVQRTDIAQPGILATSAAVIRVLESQGQLPPKPRLAAGLSLGEYTALWFAGSLRFADALRLVRLRGEAMQAASEAVPSSMLALTGATPEQAAALAAVGSGAGICAVANFNAPGQIILSGELAALDAAEAAAAQHGVRRARRLQVAGGFHSECMRPAAEHLAAALGETEISTPRFPVISNVTARPVGGPEEIRALLARQVCAPVLWEASMRHALSMGAGDFLEPAPGKVLAGLLGRIDPAARVRSVAVPGDLAATEGPAGDVEAP